MGMTHWKKLTNPDYLGAYAFEKGQEIVATIQTVKNEMVIGPDGKKEECIVARFKESSIKPMIINATNAKIITKLFKTPYIEEWSGRSIQIYVENVKAFGELVEALRVRPFIPKLNNSTSTCVDCSAEIKPSNGRTAAQLASYTQQKYGKALCASCATKIAEQKKTVDVLNESGDKPNEG